MSDKNSSRKLHRFAEDAAVLAITLIVVECCLLVLRAHNARFFFVDDYTAQFYPNMREIGRMLLQGRAPWQSDRMIMAGNSVLEFQNAVFNPVKLLFAILSQRIDDAVVFSFYFYSFYILLIGVFAYFIGAALDLPRWGRLLLSFLCALEPYAIYWQVGGWADPLSGFTWLAAAVCALLWFARTPSPVTALLVLLAIFLEFSGGWPPSIFVLSLFAGVLVGAFLVRGELRKGMLLAGAFASGVLFSMPAVIGFLITFTAVATRANAVVNQDNFSVVTLEGLLQFSNLSYREFMNSWGGYQLQNVPHFYLAWFILPVLFFIKQLPTRGTNASIFWAAAIVAGLFGLLALGPERLGETRFPSRNLQYYHFFLIIAVSLILAEGQFVFTWRRVGWLALTLSISTLATLQVMPARASLIIQSSVWWCFAIAVLLWLWWGRAGREPGGPLNWPVAPLLFGVSVVAMLALFQHEPRPRGQDWQIPADAPQRANLGARANTLFFGAYVPDSAYDEFRPANTGVITGMAQFNGYTAIGHKGLEENGFGMGEFDHGNVRFPVYRNVIASFLRREPTTGIAMIELLKIDRIISLQGEMGAAWRDALGNFSSPDWKTVDERAHTIVFTRSPYSIEGSASYAEPPLTIDHVACAEQYSDCYRVDNPTDQDRMVVFARLWYPGTVVRFDNGDVAATALGDLLVKAMVPAHYNGSLRLAYSPPGMTLALVAMFIGLLGMGLVVWRARVMQRTIVMR